MWWWYMRRNCAAVISRPSTSATTALLAAPWAPSRMKVGMYRRTNETTTIARLHLSQFLWRRIRSSIVMVVAVPRGAKLDYDMFRPPLWRHLPCPCVLYLRRIEGLRGIRHSAAPPPPSIGHACAGPRSAIAVTVHQGGPRQPTAAVAERAAKPPFTRRRSRRSDSRS